LKTQKFLLKKDEKLGHFFNFASVLGQKDDFRRSPVLLVPGIHTVE
jgi:hypothetical protein